MFKLMRKKITTIVRNIFQYIYQKFKISYKNNFEFLLQTKAAG